MSWVDGCLVGLLAVGVVACSDSIGPAARGASRVSPTTGSCGTGSTIPADGRATTSNSLGERVTDGKGADVDCTVKKKGGGYKIRGSLEEDSTKTSFFVDGTVEQVDEGVYRGELGSVGFYAANSGQVFATESCTIEILANQEIGSGRAWGNFSCVNGRLESTGSCSFEGSFVFENCD